MSSARLRVSDDAVLQVANRLTERDRRILRLLYDHRVFTTDHLTEAFFSNPTTARHRLTQLYRLRLVDRFRPRRWPADCAPYHYVIGQVGAMVIAAERDQDPDKHKWKVDKALAIGSSQRLDHLVGVNGLFVELMTHSRKHPDSAKLLEWWSERRCAQGMGGLVYPDAYGVWEQDGQVVEFLLEYDRGTESLDRIAAKLKGYKRLQDRTGVRRWVLFSLRTGRREAGVRRVLAGADVAIATAPRTAGGPQDAVWLALRPSRSEERDCLTGLDKYCQT